MSLSKSLVNEYFNFEKKYEKEYGEGVCVLMQVGSFYEIYGYITGNDKTNVKAKIQELATCLNLIIGSKKREAEYLPNFIGFPKVSLAKYIQVLIDKCYTVVLIDEKKVGSKTVRYENGVYTSTIYPIHLIESESRDNSLLSIVIELYKPIKKVNELNILLSICSLNSNTNEFHVYECGKIGTLENQIYENILDEILRISRRYQVQEILFRLIDLHNTNTKLNKQFVCNYLDFEDKNFHWISNLDDYKMFSDISIQNDYFKKIYSHINFGLITPIELFDMERHNLSVINCIYMLEFISRHDRKYIQNIAIPMFIDEYKHLVLEMNTINQLYLIPNNTSSKRQFGSLYDVINKTSSAVGKRELKQILCKPFIDKKDIELRYEFSKELDKLSEEQFIELERIIDDMHDFEKLHRKMSLQFLHPYEFGYLDKTYNNIIKLRECLSESGSNKIIEYCFNNDYFQGLRAYMGKYMQYLEIAELKYNLNETSFSIGKFFKTGSVPEVDEIYNKIEKVECEIEKIRNFYECKLLTMIKTKSENDILKLGYLEQDGWYFTCTKIRGNMFEKVLSKEEYKLLTIKNNTNVCKINTVELKRLSDELITLRGLFLTKQKLIYINFIKQWASESIGLFSILRKFVSTVDITKSNIKCKQLYNYCCPQIVESEESILDAIEIRHPIIERISDSLYIPNDIRLDNTTKGVILYALNSSGKSSLLRSIGLAVIMAQCGLYVACKEFKYAPFTSIITQVDLQDDMWKEQSSFVTEMIGLKKIMKIADKNCLVLCDELTKGTEVRSATSLFAAAVISLVRKQCKCIFTTHLQDVAHLNIIKECKDLSICHLSVVIKDDTIIFERKLKPGPTTDLYGLEVAKAVGLENELVDLAFTIRNELTNQTSVFKELKKSRYNSKKIMYDCEICGYKPIYMPLDTHHIDFQCNADSNGFNGHFHKNSKSNLVSICKKCHVKVHNNEIKINGYIMSTTGRHLDYEDLLINKI